MTHPVWLVEDDPPLQNKTYNGAPLTGNESPKYTAIYHAIHLAFANKAQILDRFRLTNRQIAHLAAKTAEDYILKYATLDNTLRDTVFCIILVLYNNLGDDQEFQNHVNAKLLLNRLFNPNSDFTSTHNGNELEIHNIASIIKEVTTEEITKIYTSRKNYRMGMAICLGLGVVVVGLLLFPVLAPKIVLGLLAIAAMSVIYNLGRFIYDLLSKYCCTQSSPGSTPSNTTPSPNLDEDTGSTRMSI